MNPRTLLSFAMLLSTAAASIALADNDLSGSADSRPHVVFMIGEREYNTKDTLPAFAREQLETRGMRCTFIHADQQDKNSFPGLQVLETADLDADAATGWWRTFRNNKHPTAKTEDFDGHAALIGNRYKLHKLGKSFELYDILADSAEQKDLASERPEVVTRMTAALETWQASVEKSLSGQDYPNAGEK